MLTLGHTGHEGDLMLVPNGAYGYMRSPSQRRGLMPAPFQQIETKTGGGSPISTVGDLDRFLRAMYRDDVINVATWRELFPFADSTIPFKGRCPVSNVCMMRDFEHDLDLVVLCNNYSAGTLASIGQNLAVLMMGHPPQVTHWRADLPSDSTRSQRLAGRSARGRAPVRRLTVRCAMAGGGPHSLSRPAPAGRPSPAVGRVVSAPQHVLGAAIRSHAGDRQASLDGQNRAVATSSRRGSKLILGGA